MSTNEGPVLVTGATGTLGRPLVERLLADGVEVRVTSRRPRPESDDRPYRWVTCDFGTGRGLDAAVDGVAVIVHCATSMRHEVAYARRLVEAVRRSGGRPHLVYVSIVGIDTNPFPYYRAKLATERLVASSDLPWTILRATQFHDLVAAMTDAQRRLPVVLTPSGFWFQPVEVSEVAARLAELARGEPAGRVEDLGGPEMRTASELARTTMRAGGWRRPVVPLRLPGRAFRAFRRGANLAPDRAVGTVTYDQYLAGRAARARR